MNAFIMLHGHIAAEAARCFASANAGICRERLPGYMVSSVLEYKAPGMPRDTDGLIIPLGEGGLYEALWILYEQYGIGCDIDIKAVPVRQETIEICALADIDPYSSDSAGSYLSVSKEIPEASLICGGTVNGWKVIGRTAEAPRKIIRIDDRIRHLDRPETFKHRSERTVEI